MRVPPALLRDVPVSDGVLAVALALGGMAEIATSHDRGGPLWLELALTATYALALAWRRVAPLACGAILVACVLAIGIWLTPVDDLFVPLLVLLTVVYSTAAYRDGAAALGGLAIVFLGVPAAVSTMSVDGVSGFLFPTGFAFVAWLTGRAVRSRTRLTDALHEAAARAAEEHDDELRRAAADERRRIARELHDLVAHSMSVMVVQAGGARRILDREPSRALEAAERIERTGREALAEMRHLLGVLHPSAIEPPALAPQPTLAGLDALVGRARAAGLPVVLRERGARRPLPSGLDLAAYRIVQEALTNALEHAGGATTEVTVEWGEHGLGLEIRDHGADGRTARDGGHGLVGMQERVKLYGGELDTGRPRGGGWRVRATLPLTKEPALL